MFSGRADESNMDYFWFQHCSGSSNPQAAVSIVHETFTGRGGARRGARGGTGWHLN